MRMNQFRGKCARAIVTILLASSAATAAANTFTIVPDISSFNPATYKWSVSVDGAPATGNPVLVVMTGQTYSFQLSGVAAHPFWIDQAPGIGGFAGTNPYLVGPALSGNDVTTNTTITMNLPADAPDTLYYACGYHGSMTNSITVVHDLVFRANFD